MKRFAGALAFNICFYGLTFLATLAATPMAFLRPDTLRPIAKAWIRMVLACLRIFCGVYPVVRDGGRFSRPGAALYACQHQSAFDTLIMMLLLPNACFVLKRELLFIPLFGWLLTQVGMIAIDRRAGASAMRSMLTQARAAVDAGMQIVIFPEGTRAAYGAPVSLQPGIAGLARNLGLDVIPVATDSGRRWARRSFLKMPGPIDIVAGEALPHGLPRQDMLAAIAAYFTHPAMAQPAREAEMA